MSAGSLKAVGVASAVCAAALLGGAAAVAVVSVGDAVGTWPRHGGEVTLRGNEMTLQGVRAKVGQTAPDAVGVAEDMSERRLRDFRGKTVVLSFVPSIETGVCSAQTRMFNERAAEAGEDVAIVTVSMDLPMAQRRFCAAEGIDQVTMLSDYRHWSFAQNFGVRIAANGLLARAVYVIDPAGKIVHHELVDEITQEPDYDAALEAVAKARGVRADG